jgi:anti-sigma factor RsiW
MNCAKARELLPTYSDKELDAPTAATLQQHLDGCTACATRLSGQRSLARAIREHAQYFEMPESLRARLQSQLPASTPARPTQAVRLASDWNRWFGLGGALAAGAVLALSIQFYVAGLGATDRLADEVVSGHVRALMADHLADVASSDHHTVKPWFAGKLDFSPPVQDLAAQGFPLAGGRLDYLSGREVAALIYRHQKHVINVFVWPAANAANSAPQYQLRSGYGLVHWTASGMMFWAVSDLNAAELTEFAKTLAVATAG